MFNSIPKQVKLSTASVNFISLCWQPKSLSDWIMDSDLMVLALLCWCVPLASGVKTALEVNLLKPTGYVMHQQFNIRQLNVLPTLYLCVLYLSENKQRLVQLTA